LRRAGRQGRGRPDAGLRAAARLTVYLEGPLDHDVLRGFALRLGPRPVDSLFGRVVLLGGRQPGRALAHFAELAAADPRACGVCVLDRDGEGPEPPPPGAPAGFEVFTWRRRHIESYLLVPEAIRRSLRNRVDRGRVERALRDALPAGSDETWLREVDAKRLLAPDGRLARALGTPLRPGAIARAMRPSEIHDDVKDLFDRLRRARGMGPPGGPVVARRRPVP